MSTTPVASIDLPAEIMEAILSAMGDDATPEERGEILTTLGVSWAEAVYMQALTKGRVGIEKIEGTGWCFVAPDGRPLWVLDR
jgi:hypothetical protein